MFGSTIIGPFILFIVLMGVILTFCVYVGGVIYLAIVAKRKLTTGNSKTAHPPIQNPAEDQS